MESLSERVSVLERAQSGAPAFPRPGPTPARGAPSESDAVAPAAEPEPPATPPPPAEVARRPSLGALQRSKEVAAPAPAQPQSPPPAAETPQTMEAEPVAKAPAVSTASTASAGSTSAGSASARSSPAGATKTLDRDDLTEAWGDGILQSLPARAKARYASGRFVAVDEQGAHFALPNAAHREQCVEQQAEVEKALSDHFGTKVALVLHVDDSLAPPAAGPGPSPAASPRPAGGAPPPPPPPAEEVDYVDPSELEDASTDQASAAQARLLQAFPGASEVAE
jgi:hypothetical protein